MNVNDQTPLLALADALRSRSEIKSLILTVADTSLSSCFKNNFEFNEAVKFISNEINDFLEGRAFSGFNKKTTIAKVVATVLSTYKRDIKNYRFEVKQRLDKHSKHCDRCLFRFKYFGIYGSSTYIGSCHETQDILRYYFHHKVYENGYRPIR